MRLTEIILIQAGVALGLLWWLYRWRQSLAREQDLLDQKRALLDQMERQDNQRRAINTAVELAQGRWSIYLEPKCGEVALTTWWIGKN